MGKDDFITTGFGEQVEADLSGLNPSLPDDQDDLTIFHLDPDNMPTLPPDLIQGIIKAGQIGMLSGASKIGKTHLALEMAIALATGSNWLGYKCKPSRTLYVDGEVGQDFFSHELLTVFNGLIQHNQLLPEQIREVMENIGFTDVRDYFGTLLDLEPILIEKLITGNFDVLIIDPIYLLMDGDENAMRDVRGFMRCLNRIAKRSNCSIIFVHHHGKGDKANTRSIDRAGGSGGFGRFVHSVIDVIELDVDEVDRENMGLGNMPVLRVETDPRNFDKSIFEIFFMYPIHLPIAGDQLADCKANSAAKRGGRTSGKQKQEQRKEKIKKVETLLEELLAKEQNTYEHDGKRLVSQADLSSVVEERLGIRDRHTVSEYIKDSAQIQKLMVGRNAYLFMVD